MQRPLRSINIMNFIRAEEPRETMDLFEPVVEQSKLIRKFGFPCTWLFQYDALVEGDFVGYLKGFMNSSDEVGLWLEMNRQLCDAAKVVWRGRPGWNWDYHVPVAYSIGYTPEERVRLANAAVEEFTKVWRRKPESIASWNLDAFTIRHLSRHHGIKTFAVCRDQIATDGFTIWGAPIAGYFPSNNNAWSCAVDADQQLDASIFRLLAQDPVYYYDHRYRLENGEYSEAPDTMEPVWPSGQSQRFVQRFFHMLAKEPCLEFAYAQLGQENSFGWPAMKDGYRMQMQQLVRHGPSINVETMAETGRKFRLAFTATPLQAQVQLEDPFGHDDRPQRTLWFQSRFYRANLHFDCLQPFFRDISVYRDSLAQPYLNTPTRQHGVSQRIPAVLDGYHWGDPKTRAGGFLEVDGEPITMIADPLVEQHGPELHAHLKTNRGDFEVSFTERQIRMRCTCPFELHFRWISEKSAFVGVVGQRLNFRHDGFDYGVDIENGRPEEQPMGVAISADRLLVIELS